MKKIIQKFIKEVQDEFPEINLEYLDFALERFMNDFDSQASELPSDEEIQDHVGEVEDINFDEEIGYVLGAKWMRSIALASRDARILELEEVVQSLADWSRKYPKGRIYPMSKITMDDELSEIENKAKELTTPKN